MYVRALDGLSAATTGRGPVCPPTGRPTEFDGVFEGGGAKAVAFIVALTLWSDLTPVKSV